MQVGATAARSVMKRWRPLGVRLTLWRLHEGELARIEVPATRQGKEVHLVYCSYLHPELFRENGRVMIVTFSPSLQNAGFDENCEMVEIEVKRTGGS